MGESSSPKHVRRPYHSPMRQRQAEETRRRILESSGELFLSRGYTGTTVGTIAEAAGVSPETISAVFGSKRGILAELLNPDRFGGRFRERVDRIRSTPDPRRRVRLVAQLCRQVYEAFTPEFELLRGANLVAPELGDLARQIEERRRRNQAKLIGYLRESGVLRAGLAPKEATDELWALTSYDLYRKLVAELGWDRGRYEAWLAEVLSERLLG